MNNRNFYTCTFFGHRDIFKREEVKKRLYKKILELINQGVKRFIVGTHGDFDKLVLSVLRAFNKDYDIKILVVFTSINLLKKGKINYSIADSYNDVETFMYNIENEFYKSRIILSNKKMIDESDIIISYIDLERYRSGAKISYLYALKNNKMVVNLFDRKDKVLKK